MGKKRKPHEERKSEDYMEAAENALELAKVLAGQGQIGDQDFLERTSRSDDLVEHDGEMCCMCHSMILGAQIAREMIEAGEYEGRGEQVGGGKQTALGEEQVFQTLAKRAEGWS